MDTSVGARIGPYEIVSPLGTGGMGEVYRARDTRLGREVAIKLSKEKFTERFDREARTIASLNHSNICHLYDVGPNYLVMELIEGITLRERLKEGPLSEAEAIRIAMQIADALGAAHEKEIVHRDLKPGNVKLKPDGSAKVLDFGLAKVGRAAVTASGSPIDPELSPTISMAAATEAGVILGTAGYMSPEQAKGKTVDKRADIWAFGVVLFEMLTGKRLFKGEDGSETLAAVIRDEPDYSHIPARLRPLLQMCLRKDPNKRLHDIADARLMLEQLRDASPELAPAVIAIAPQRSSRWMWVAVPVVVLAIVGGAWGVLHPATELRMFQMEINPPEGVKFVATITPFALSPDGRKLAVLGVDKEGKRKLYLRSIDSEKTAALPGTESAEVPFWSPDSRWVGFSANGKLLKLDVVSGGQPQVICEIEGRAGGSWSPKGVILFDQGAKPLQRVPASGGTPTSVFPLNASRGEATHLAPFFLPDGEHFLYYSTGKTTDTKFGSLDGKTNRVLLERQAVPTFALNPAGGGWMMYAVRGQLLARPFDPVNGEFLGQPAPIAEGVNGGRWWYASTNGILAFRHNYGTQFQLAWFGRDGKPQGTVGDPGVIASPRISPDQKTVVFERSTDQNVDLWTYDLARSTTARFTFEPERDWGPIWSADGRNIIYTSERNSSFSLVERPANSIGQEMILASKTGDPWRPMAESRDGKWLALIEASPVHSIILLRSREDPNKIVRIRERESERDASISADGRWLLYSSVPASRREVFVQSLPKETGGSANGAGKWQISSAGGSQPVWRADGKEIFFVAADGMMTAVPIESSENSFRPGAPRPLFQTRLEFDNQQNNASSRQYDVTSDGQRFLINQHVADATDQPITVVVNWPKLLEK